MSLWVPASCPHRPAELYVEIRSAEEMIIQCRRCKGVWDGFTAPEEVLQSVKELLDAGAFRPKSVLP